MAKARRIRKKNIGGGIMKSGKHLEMKEMKMAKSEKQQSKKEAGMAKSVAKKRISKIIA